MKGIEQDPSTDHDQLPVWDSKDLAQWRAKLPGVHVNYSRNIPALLELLKYSTSCLASLYDGIEQDKQSENLDTLQTLRAQMAVLCAFDTLVGIGTLLECYLSETKPVAHPVFENAIQMHAIMQVKLVLGHAAKSLQEAGWHPDAEAIKEDLLKYNEL